MRKLVYWFLISLVLCLVLVLGACKSNVEEVTEPVGQGAQETGVTGGAPAPGQVGAPPPQTGAPPPVKGRR
ncbi:hypothetical protein HRbin15_01067 [bacterium HR15]|nr:hypothetical protein HRbin15_01067 [bacterium HR15]